MWGADQAGMCVDRGILNLIVFPESPVMSRTGRFRLCYRGCLWLYNFAEYPDLDVEETSVCLFTTFTPVTWGRSRCEPRFSTTMFPCSTRPLSYITVGGWSCWSQYMTPKLLCRGNGRVGVSIPEGESRKQTPWAKGTRKAQRKYAKSYIEGQSVEMEASLGISFDIYWVQGSREHRY